jgi:hypothetical protein
MSDEAVLVVGVYLADEPNLVADIVSELGRSREWRVDQRWVGLGQSSPVGPVSAVTVEQVATSTPKFTLLNRLLGQRSYADYAFVLVCDDDVLLPSGFLDDYLRFVTRHDLALCQPARTHDSFVDHPFVGRLEGLSARRTQFVEIGPLFSIHRSAFSALLPFDEASPMGWGYDLAWPCTIALAGLRMGIVDATPIEHSFRQTLTHYNRDLVQRQMDAYLVGRAHLTRDEAFVILESFE